MSADINLFDGVSDDFPYRGVEGLKGYLNDIWQSRPLFLREEDDEDEIRGREQRFFKFTNGKIKPWNYVGFVQYGDLRINVYPRVFKKESTNIEDISASAIQHVLTWLQYAQRVHFPFSEISTHLESQDDWLEALIFVFANYTNDILSNSPHFAYQELTEEMSFVRGRIAMQPYINDNLVKGRHHLLHCTYEPFEFDNLFNRIVKHTSKILMSTTRTFVNRQLLDSILFLLDDVSDVNLAAADCDRVPVNRLYPELNVITSMCAAFLSNQVYSDESNNQQNLCILLPMELIYEQYIGGFLEKHFPELNIDQQASDEYVARTGEGFAKKVFQMQHDILINDKLIIDTKYKFRYAKDEEWKAGVSQADLYQMVTYCFKRKINNGMLLYPMHFDTGAKNSKHIFRVDDKDIEAVAVDITEDDLTFFENLQKQKFELLLQTFNEKHNDK